MPEQSGDRRYDATPHRRQKAREEGRIPKSQDLSSAIVLVGALLVILVIGEMISGNLVEYIRNQLSESGHVDTSTGELNSTYAQFIRTLAWTSLPVMALVLLIALASHVFQTGFVFLPKRLNPELKKVSPLAGLKRMFSLTNLVKLLFGIFKVLIVATVAGVALWGERDMMKAMGGADVALLLKLICQMVIRTSMKIAVALLILAILDYWFQRWKNNQDLRMTEQEMRDELKTTQGDPQVLGRRRAVQQQLVRNRIENSVPEANAIVTNPTELAVAIQYDPQTMVAPIVVAKGAGLLAQRIRRLGLEHGIPIVERKELARLLYREVEINHPIPPAQYAAVAEVLRYVYELKGQSVEDLTQAANAA